jgi:hypothetical protein
MRALLTHPLIVASLCGATLVLCACGSDDPASAATGAGAGSGATTSGPGGAGGSSSSSSSQSSSGTAGAGGSGGGAMADLDGDGLDDGVEADIAATYLPFLSLDPGDGCPLRGIVYRVTPHAADPAMLHVIYDNLFETDCGTGGHVGDNEVFAITVDPTEPPAQGIKAMKAIGHQNTACQQITECGVCPGLDACDTQTVNGAALPVIYFSDGKHASYAQKCTIVNCLDACTLAPTTSAAPMVNAGEPAAHLTENLTTNGFITAENGWTEAELMNYNPWDPATDFGGAGNVAGDLVDPAFDTPACP